MTREWSTQAEVIDRLPGLARCVTAGIRQLLRGLVAIAWGGEARCAVLDALIEHEARR